MEVVIIKKTNNMLNIIKEDHENLIDKHQISDKLSITDKQTDGLIDTLVYRVIKKYLV